MIGSMLVVRAKHGVLQIEYLEVIMRLASILSIIILSLALPALADDQADLKKAMDQFDATYLEGFNKRDPAVMATHFTADAVVLTRYGLVTDVKKLFEAVLKAGFDHAEVKTDQF